MKLTEKLKEFNKLGIGEYLFDDEELAAEIPVNNLLEMAYYQIEEELGIEEATIDEMEKVWGEYREWKLTTLSKR